MENDFAKRKNNRKRSVIFSGSKESSSTKQLPNSLIMRVMEDSGAEKEADRLSQGIKSRTPDELLSEMGGRLGADFSDVSFHNDSLSMSRSQALGARAFAQGSNIYFGKGGFDPKVAAHELVHTVQQGAVPGNTTQSAPYGAVQLFSGEDDNAIHRRAVPANAANLELMTQQKDSSEYGIQVFRDLKKSVKKLAQKSGSRIREVSEDSGLTFLANLGERDYTGKEILRDIATRTVINKDEQYDRTDEYEGFLDYMKNRTDKVGLEAASMQAGILNGQPKYNHNNDENIKKRAYEMTAEELSNDTFNPTHDTEIAEVLKKIDAAQNENEAYYAFLGYTDNKEYSQEEINNGRMVVNFARQPIPIINNDQGVPTEVDPSVAKKQKTINDEIEAKITDANTKINDAKKAGKRSAKGSQEWENAKQEFLAAQAALKAAQTEKTQKAKEIRYRYKQGATVNVPLLKAKLKNMVRQIRDYPELKHKIGGLNIQWNQSLGAYRDEVNRNVMAATTSAGGRDKATIHYDAYIDRNSPEAQQERDEANESLAGSIGNLNKVGNHELGHVLESTLNVDEDDQLKGVASNDILQSVLPKVMTPQEQAQVNYNRQDGTNAYNKNVYQGQIDTASLIFKTKKMSSDYGQSMPKEWFAEAFHDVYTKGAEAKPTSIEIVKEYERRQTVQQKANFTKKKAGVLTRIGRWFSKWVNFGRRHGDPEPVAAQPQMNGAIAAADPIAGMPPVIEANANPEPDADDLNHYEDNLLSNVVGRNNEKNNEDNPLDISMIVNAPKRKNIKKKKKTGKK